MHVEMRLEVHILVQKYRALHCMKHHTRVFLRSHTAHIHLSFKPTISATTIWSGELLFVLHSSFVSHSSAHLAHHWIFKSSTHLVVESRLPSGSCAALELPLLPDPARVGKPFNGVIIVNSVRASPASSDHTAASATHHARLAVVTHALRTGTPAAPVGLARAERCSVGGVRIESVLGVHPIIGVATAREWIRISSASIFASIHAAHAAHAAHSVASIPSPAVTVSASAASVSASVSTSVSTSISTSISTASASVATVSSAPSSVSISTSAPVGGHGKGPIIPPHVTVSSTTISSTTISRTVRTIPSPPSISTHTAIPTAVPTHPTSHPPVPVSAIAIPNIIPIGEFAQRIVQCRRRGLLRSRFLGRRRRCECDFVFGEAGYGLSHVDGGVVREGIGECHHGEEDGDGSLHILIYRAVRRLNLSLFRFFFCNVSLCRV
mmetsp:Transcript_15298/g.27315  ORF Transcript_15298/g.27315 Transcript_15298/m.27315 type:complete len:438 (-) Transcript_15298:123-1436(-)